MYHKKHSLNRLLCFSLLLFVFGQPIKAMSQGFGPEPKQGWHLSAGTGIGLLAQTKMSQKTINSYDDDAELKEKIIPIPHFKLSRLDDDLKSNWSIKFLSGSLFIERNQDSGIGQFSISAGHSLPDFGFELDRGIYENPYLLGEEREATTISKLTYSIKYVSDKKLGLAIGFQGDKISFEKDTTPEIISELGRNGIKTTSTIGLNLFFLRYHYSQLNMKAEGVADSNNGISQRLLLSVPLYVKGLLFIVSYTEGETLFNEENPIFSKTREDDINSQMYQIRWNTEDFTMYAMTLNAKKDSTINFFDEQLTMQSIGLIWKF